ncbi:MAG: putative rRNA maturation factor [Candidatus Magasanikbacteria bacterium GW2011_GWA2_45_39]|uniref:Putative rRNA maturation factor n=1 Tax=Candidatus Magasanikbacteria bacterium GW2011_GWA2_45_39 TaxID=1619041 RepID=A0A0G1MEW3_9BACT|nr:MAG: putative rRNA maturation factor [Candidatus Magasanikbacteria bacterium GW2011_GWA2_45_39]
MRDLNRKFRQLDETGDVLSFPLENRPDPTAVSPDGLLRLGDIVVSWPQARDLAVKSNRLISAVVCDLVEHGVKHLLGEHHS